MILPVFVSFAIAMQEPVAIRLLINVAASLAGTIPSFCFTVKVRPFWIVCLPAATIIRAGEHAVLVSDLVGALAVVVVRIVALRVNDRVVIGRRTIAIISVTVTMSVAISVAIAAAISVPISSATGITARAVAVIGISARAVTSGNVTRSSAAADAPGSYYLAVLRLNSPIAPIAAAIDFPRAAPTSVAAIIS
jgi:hypothetical protein